MKAVLRHIHPVAPGVYTFWFEPAQRIRYIAGQFTELYLPHDSDSRGDKRWFTLSSSPSEPLLGITTRFKPGQSSSFKQQLHALQIGDEVTLAEPMGDFVLPKDPSIPLLFVVSGIGVTPVRSIIKYLSDNNERRTIRFLHAAKRPSDLIFRDLFEAYPLISTLLVQQASSEWNGDTGPLSTERIRGEARKLQEPFIYLSGPEHVVEVLDAELKKAGVPPERVITDYFHGYR